MSRTVLFSLREINRFLETLSSCCIFEKALFHVPRDSRLETRDSRLDPRDSRLDPRDSRLDTRDLILERFEYRGSSLEYRVSSVNLFLSGTVHVKSKFFISNTNHVHNWTILHEMVGRKTAKTSSGLHLPFVDDYDRFVRFYTLWCLNEP